LHQQRRERYRAGVQQLLTGFGHDYWYGGGGGGGGGGGSTGPTVVISRAGDFNGDGKHDIVTFTHGANDDAVVSLSNGAGFLGSSVWNGFFAIDGELPSVGDFDGDGKDDIVTFTRGTRGDVVVARSTGSSFAGAQLWHDFFAIDGETPGVGDFNGDGKDDIIAFTRGSRDDVLVSLSTGAGFTGAAVWHDFFAIDGEVPAIGDFNGDGKDDIVTFTRGTAADVIVSLSNGSGFVGAAKWHDFFAAGTELPVVADFNGDGKDDIATFTRGSRADVIVSLSTGTGFGPPMLWHDFFAIDVELPGAGDFDGDGKADAIVFTRGTRADVFVARSTGAAFEGGSKWYEFFAPGGETPHPATNVF
jgi:hypothetical protein